MSILAQVVLLIVVTLIPALELRASIPFGILYGSPTFGIEEGALPWPLVVLVCTLANIVLGWGVFFVLGPVFRFLDRFSYFHRFVQPILSRTREKLRPYVERYGEWGVAVFIGIPLPGSGVYTGAVGAFVLGLDRRKFSVANVLGVLLASAAVTTVSLLLRSGVELPALQWILKGGH